MAKSSQKNESCGDSLAPNGRNKKDRHDDLTAGVNFLPSSGKIRVFLADDHAMVREGLAALVARDLRIEIIGQCGDGLKVVAQVMQCMPDVLVLDITMPGLNGLDICRSLTKKCKDIVILILTMHDDHQFIASAFEHGARGYLLKESAAEQFSEAIVRVFNKELYLGQGISPEILKHIGRGKSNGDGYESLSNRERQVLHLIVEGKTNRQIAEQLELAVKTVDTHRTRLMGKLNIHDQTSLVKFALRKGIVTLR